MAPEQLHSQGKSGYDLSIDIWSLGCVLYEIVTGEPPFAADNIDDMKSIIFTQEVEIKQYFSKDFVSLL
jgi:eukaryotic-like serine/threonine-protein kinase